MGVIAIVGFAACWLLVATLMLWGVFTEKKRGEMRGEPPTGTARWHRGRNVGAVADTGWAGAGAGGTWPGGRTDLGPATEWVVVEAGDGVSTTRGLVRSAALQTTRRRR